ncbi:unnamed protein product [Clonostachys byssicola]|uniref:Cytidyltransferase-like domain-containing protein n=1 Tax=Clonostachys byssicola TaxID=160290 RepID=A0A9N9U4Y5_9HYPO|nr:unnamed protein product [Clonostachys byssicola]
MSAQNDPLNMSLGYHAELALHGGIAPPGTPNLPWNSRRATDPPLVRPNLVTKILVFPARFNPIHDAHLTFLDHVFTRSGFDKDADFQAAIIYCMDDEHVERDLEGRPLPQPGRFLLELNRRQAVSYKLVEHNDRYWVWDYGDSNRFGHFILDLRQRLHDRVGQGTRIELYALVGPDELLPHRPDPRTWHCDHLITSNIAPGPNLLNEYILPKRLPGCAGWTYYRDNFEPTVRETMGQRMAGRAAAEVARIVMDTQHSTYCLLEGVPGGQAKLVYIPHFPGKDGHAEARWDMSSTKIRVLIAEMRTSNQNHLSRNVAVLRAARVSSLLATELARLFNEGHLKWIVTFRGPGHGH